ncbi:phosphatase PAP2 family protein [Mucilaginibacter pallidiroseus]|uniref:Phosphatase PAP2 family protein n=1 Tax=Mucilaginibacter pallidiroseus TaxID=2599295 RepID=A0A563UJI6_9SPHI|nr:phosphatase PAP2 family protein [Mucilaginibacter pallidiroseus]TWR31515.1 phosphatase PAP2 family protein [Mucilaginibacter pallidiroseus]
MKFKLLILMLTLSASTTIAQNFDAKLLSKINPNGGYSSTWGFVSNNAVQVAVAAPFAMMAVGIIEHDPLLKRNAVNTGVALLATGLITQGVKSTIQRQRPFMANQGMIFQQGNAGGYSFPSGHTSATFSLATSLSLSYSKWYVIAPSFAFAGATAYSRMYRGAHYPGDVLGGIIVGTGTSFLTWKLQKWIYKYNKAYNKGFVKNK